MYVLSFQALFLGDPLVNSESNSPANTDTSSAQNGQPSNPSTFDDGTVPPPPTFSRSSAEGEDYTSPRGDLPSQDHADPAPSPASPLANALAQMAKPASNGHEPGVCENGALNNQHTKPPLQRPVLFRFIIPRLPCGPRLEGALTRDSALTRDIGSYTTRLVG